MRASARNARVADGMGKSAPSYAGVSNLGKSAPKTAALPADKAYDA